MQPIQTIFKGYKFRSRLEARWAVFFDALGLDWEYEPEGYDLGRGFYYLPDLKVLYPGRNKSERHYEWFEIKGDISRISLEECEKIARFGENERITVIDGPPRPTMFLSINPMFGGGAELEGECVTGKTLQSELKNLAETKMEHRSGNALWSLKGRMWWDEHENYFTPTTYFGSDNSIEYACDRARQARFEHGESP